MRFPWLRLCTVAAAARAEQRAVLAAGLASLSMKELRTKAKATGAGAEDLEHAADADDPKAALILLLTSEPLLAQLLEPTLQLDTGSEIVERTADASAPETDEVKVTPVLPSAATDASPKVDKSEAVRHVPLPTKGKGKVVHDAAPNESEIKGKGHKKLKGRGGSKGKPGAKGKGNSGEPPPPPSLPK